jgi:hypothetical protein
MIFSLRTKTMNRLSIAVILFCISASSYAQITSQELNGRLGDVNVITTAVPFLTIAPDSRSGGMGDAGVATTPDINSQHHNSAKYPFIKNNYGVSISYTPWLRQLVDDINLAYISGYSKIGAGQVVSGSLRYFSLGDITFTDINGSVTGQHRPNEFALDMGYSRLLTPAFSMGINLRYINSNLTGGYSNTGSATNAGQAYAADIAAFYTKEIELEKKPTVIAAGINISNLGSKLSYTDNADKDFLPAMLKLGASMKTELDDYNTILFTVEMSKYLVPTPPVWDTIYDNQGNLIPKYGKSPNVSVPVGIFQSFWDAPGVEKDPLNPADRSVGLEEWREINWSIGTEYWYAKQFAIRAGYFYEHATKGNRKFFTVGLGLKLNVFGLDFSYLIPVNQRNPLENTLRFTLLFDFEGVKKNDTSSPNGN